MTLTRIRELRLEKGLTIKTLATKLNIKESTLSKYERAEREPSIEVLILLSEFFNVSIDYLVGKDDCRDTKYQAISNTLGIDEKTIEILLLLSATTYKYSNLDYLEAIIQHPQFPALLNQINSYITNDAQGWHDLSIPDSNGNIINTISGEVMRASSMQLILTSFKGIVEGIPYSKHFLNKK